MVTNLFFQQNLPQDLNMPTASISTLTDADWVENHFSDKLYFLKNIDRMAFKV